MSKDDELRQKAVDALLRVGTLYPYDGDPEDPQVRKRYWKTRQEHAEQAVDAIIEYIRSQIIIT